MKTWFYFLSCALLLVCMGCENTTKDIKFSKMSIIDRPVETFKRILIKSSNVNVYIKQGEVETLKIEADESLIGTFSTTIENESLIIEQNKETDALSQQLINFYITVKNIHTFSLYGQGQVFTEGNIKIDKLKVNLFGSVKANFDVTGHEFLLKAMGSANIQIKGQVEIQKIYISGNGNYEAENLVSNEAYVYLKGASDAKINVIDDLTVQISGSGKIKYQGLPQINQTISGSGSIEAIK